MMMSIMTTLPIKMRMARAPFVFLLLAGLSWIALCTIQLPPVDRFVWLPPPSEATHHHVVMPHQLRVNKPLRPTNLEIVRNATQIDLTYVDISKNHTDHPHCGARDAEGTFGYVHDETALRRSPPAFSTERLQQDCQERDSNYIMLTKRVFVDQEAHDARSSQERVKILCIIYSTDEGHEKKIPAIRETWG